MSPKKDVGFSDEEKAAMKEHLAEQKAAARRGARPDKAEEEKVVLAKIDELEEPDRAIALRLHELVMAVAPELWPRLWYGMPAYAKDGKVICFFQSSKKFKTRYSTFGFNDPANLDDGNLWPVSYALMKLTAVEEAKIRELVKQAVS